LGTYEEAEKEIQELKDSVESHYTAIKEKKARIRRKERGLKLLKD